VFGVGSLEDYIQILEKEVNIDFCCSMNRITFDQTVNEDRVTFAFVTLPEKDVEMVPARGTIITFIQSTVIIDSVV